MRIFTIRCMAVLVICISLIIFCFSFVSCSKKTNTASSDTSGSETTTSTTEPVISSTTTTTSNTEIPTFLATQTSPIIPEPPSYTEPEPQPPPITTTTEAREVTVLIPEGYSLSQIGDKLQSSGVCSKADFLSTINSYDFSYYPLVAKIPADENRCYKLEGYLFPNTYTFYKNMKPQDAIGKMLRGAESQIGDKYSYTGFTTDEIITMASIIEKEGASSSDRKKISSVIHNRLKAGMKLQMDSSIYYIERYVRPNMDYTTRYGAYYNTNKCAALPKGPICNPGSLALNAAVNPDNTDYLYFVSDKAGTYYFATTYEEQKANCVLAGITPESAQS